MPSMRKAIEKRRPKAVLLQDFHHFVLLLGGELLKVGGNRRLAKVAGRWATSVISRTQRPDDEPNPIVVPISFLSRGHGHLVRRDFDSAIADLEISRNLFRALPDCSLKQFYLGRCLCLLLQCYSVRGSTDRGYNISGYASHLLRTFRALIDREPSQRDYDDRLDNVLFKLIHHPDIWYERCLYDLVEITTAYLALRPPLGAPLYVNVVQLLAARPAEGFGPAYSLEKELALALSVSGFFEDAVVIWRRLLRWKNKPVKRSDEEDDSIRFRLLACLLVIDDVGEETMKEYEKIDVARSLIHYEHGQILLYLVRRLLYRKKMYRELTSLCKRIQQICDARFSPDHLVVVVNRYYYARILKKSGKYDRAVVAYKKLLMILRPFLDDDEYLPLTLPELSALYGDARKGLAHALRLAGRIDESIFQYRKALEDDRLGILTDRKARHGILKSLAYLYEQNGDVAEAIIAYDLLHREYLGLPAKDISAAIKCSWYRGKMFHLMGQPGHALALFRHAATICGARRMENARTRWPTNDQLQLTRILMESDDVDEEEGRDQGKPQKSTAEPSEQTTEQTAEASSRTAKDLQVSRPQPPEAAAHGEPTRTQGTEVTEGSTSTIPNNSRRTTANKIRFAHLVVMDFDDVFGYGPDDTGPKCIARSVDDKDRVWAQTISNSIEAVERGDTIENPAPLDCHDSDWEDEGSEFEGETVGDAPFASIGRRPDELVFPRFDRLPATYHIFLREKSARERYPWRV